MIHSAAAVALAVSQHTADWRPGREATHAALGMLAILFALLAGGMAVAFVTSGGLC